MNEPTIPALPPGPTDAPPPKPHPIDVALAALSEYAAEVLTGDRPNRFAELQTIMQVSMAVQRLKPPEIAGVADMGMGEFGDDGFGVGGVNFGAPVMAHNPIHVRRGHIPRWNDGADMQTQMMMMAQNFLKEYTAIEKAKASKPDPDVRLNEVSELAELFMLRLKLAGADQEVPPEINYRVNALLKRIGEPPHEPAPSEPGPDTVLPADPLRGHQADGAGQPDGGRVGEPVAE